MLSNEVKCSFDHYTHHYDVFEDYLVPLVSTLQVSGLRNNYAFSFPPYIGIVSVLIESQKRNQLMLLMKRKQTELIKCSLKDGRIILVSKY